VAVFLSVSAVTGNEKPRGRFFSLLDEKEVGMNQNHRIIGIRNWRDQRNRCERSKQSSPQSFNKMENTMFEALRKLGGYRIDYMNREIMGSSDALGFYILGNLPAGQPYSHSAKHSLLAGLIVLRDLGEIENLVAIYLDVNEAGNALRPAYVRMKQDMRSGMFRRLFVLDANDLAGDSQTAQDWWMFTRQLKRFEVVSFGDEQLYELNDIMLAQCDHLLIQELQR